MPIIAGHALVLSLPFANGTPCNYKRPFLVIENYNNSSLDLLNVSSIRGKERKLLFPSNERINNFNPPLDAPSFIKMDELYTIDYFEDLHKSIYKRRSPIDSSELSRLVNEYTKYSAQNPVTQVRYIETTVRQRNSL
ncbi:hypothetical protein [Halobacillus sp. Marseille-P3879]|uniref:hypothetical protein n=1 Tax=Halobacillus sp. Marseille-P3879 TaxID=2045014 RepID=UPI000C7D49B7|nr:hypothetical protein [Halobacillus sp. Marseille-P3879]